MFKVIYQGSILTVLAVEYRESLRATFYYVKDPMSSRGVWIQESQCTMYRGK